MPNKGFNLGSCMQTVSQLFETPLLLLIKRCFGEFGLGALLSSAHGSFLLVLKGPYMMLGIKSGSDILLWHPI